MADQDVQPLNDMVNHPDHYTKGGIESIDVIEAKGLGFCAGNAVKYILRYQYKGTPLQDLKKAQWYLNRLISNMEQEDGTGDTESIPSSGDSPSERNP